MPKLESRKKQRAISELSLELFSALTAIAFARGLIIVSVIVAPFGIRPNTRPNCLDSNHRIGNIFERRLPGQSQENQHCLIEAD